MYTTLYMHPPTPSPRQATDLALRTLWRYRPESIVRLALPEAPLAVQRQDSAVRGVHRDPDGVATVLRASGGPCTLFVEFETDARPALAQRMAHAAWVLHGASDPLPVRGVAVLVEPRPDFPGQYDMLDGDDVLGTYRYTVVSLQELRAADLLDVPDTQAGLLALVPLTGDAGPTEIAAAAARLHDLRTPDAAELTTIAYLLAGRRIGYADAIRLFDTEFFMQSSTYNALYTEAWTKGVHKGREEGREEGREQGQRTALAHMLRLRFGEHLAARAAAVDAQQLDAAVDGVVLATSEAEAESVLARCTRA